MALLVAHCQQVSEAAIRVLKLSPLSLTNGVGVEGNPDLAKCRTPSQTATSHLHLSSCRGLTRILPHLTLNIICDIISRVLPALLGVSSGPEPGPVRDEALSSLSALLKYLDEINWRCCTESYDIASTSLCPERRSIYRTWKESRPHFLLSHSSSPKLLHQRGVRAISEIKEPVVIHSLVYDLGLLHCAEGHTTASLQSLLSELAPLTERKELDASHIYDRLPLSIAARETLASCNVGFVWVRV
ncbi:unnamed protein product [Dibothriocephalus latus]|uniref:Uncharacterized protein n=1 Tax=Dibothriocephalus latus TaxID=60516 RepID=A0A3P7MNL2_DIBLA|nr:unnamed protein product [Dibothriocephalus latus]